MSDINPDSLTAGDVHGVEWIPATDDDLCTIMTYTEQDKVSVGRFIGCIRACGYDIAKAPRQQSRKENDNGDDDSSQDPADRDLQQY